MHLGAMRSHSYLESIKSVRRPRNPELPSDHKFVAQIHKQLSMNHLSRLHSMKLRKRQKTVEVVNEEELPTTSSVKEALEEIRSQKERTGATTHVAPKEAEKNLYDMLYRERNMQNNKHVGKQNMKSLLEIILLLQANHSWKLGGKSRW